MKTLKLIIVISCCAVNSYSQSLGDSLDLMKKTLLIEYRIWLVGNKDTCYYLLFKKARLLKQANLLDWSYRELGRIGSDNKTSDPLSYEKAINSFLRSDFSNAFHQLSNIPDSIRRGTKSYLYLWLLTLSELSKWDECKSLLSKTTLYGKIRDEKFASLQTTLKYKSPEKASRLSSYLPGLGQMYTGNWGKGTTSIIIHAGLFWFTWQQYAAAYFITGTFAGVYPIQRFYKGGRTLSYNLAIQYNEKLERETKLHYQKVIRKLFE